MIINQAATFDQVANDWSPVEWAFHVWSWIFLFVLFVVLEIWGNPLLASLALCLKFDWRDVLVGIRLWRQSSSRGVGSLGLYSLALACLKVAFAGSVVTTGVVACEYFFGVPFQIGCFLAGFTMLLFGLGVAEMVILLAARNANVDGFRCWLDGTIYENLFRRDVELRCHGSRNRVRWLLSIGVLLCGITFLPGLVAAVVMLLRFGNPAGIPGGIIFAVFFVLYCRSDAKIAGQPGHVGRKVLVSAACTPSPTRV